MNAVKLFTVQQHDMFHNAQELFTLLVFQHAATLLYDKQTNSEKSNITAEIEPV